MTPRDETYAMRDAIYQCCICAHMHSIEPYNESRPTFVDCDVESWGLATSFIGAHLLRGTCPHWELDRLAWNLIGE